MISKDIKGICELFDCQVCNDLESKGSNDHLQAVYYIGAYPELSAGLYGFCLTPHFFSMVALAEYCASKNGHNKINANAKKVFSDWLPDYEDWFDNICDGCLDIRGAKASEHHCHTWSPFGTKSTDFYMHRGERVNGECGCCLCHPIKEVA